MTCRRVDASCLNLDKATVPETILNTLGTPEEFQLTTTVGTVGKILQALSDIIDVSDLSYAYHDAMKQLDWDSLLPMLDNHPKQENQLPGNIVDAILDQACIQEPALAWPS